jgi:hypothetical protein
MPAERADPPRSWARALSSSVGNASGRAIADCAVRPGQPVVAVRPRSEWRSPDRAGSGSGMLGPPESESVLRLSHLGGDNHDCQPSLQPR